MQRHGIEISKIHSGMFGSIYRWRGLPSPGDKYLHRKHGVVMVVEAMKAGRGYFVEFVKDENHGQTIHQRGKDWERGVRRAAD